MVLALGRYTFSYPGAPTLSQLMRSEESSPFSAPPASGARLRIPAALRSVLAALTLTLVFGAGVATDRLVWNGGPGAGASSSITDSEKFDVLQQTWDAIHTEYVETEAIDDQELIYGASRGMVDALGDTGHSRFLDPEEANDFEQEIRGETVGIGIYLDLESAQPTVIAPIEGGPADQAGIQAGDVILEIGGEPVEGLTPEELRDRLGGDEGTRVSLTLRRGQDKQPYTVTLSRAKLVIRPVSWSMLPDGVAHLRLSEFSGGATEALKEAIQEIREAGATKMVLDMRDNPGGLVFEAIGVSSQFLPEGATIYQERDRAGSVRRVTAVGEGVALDLPLVVLVNGNSASAAEIVAAALRDNGRASLVGERTYGTGTVLTSTEFTDGSMALIGTSLWLTADGEQIWKRGVDPDQTVVLEDDVYPTRPSQDPDVTEAELAQSKDDQLVAGHDRLQRRNAALPSPPADSTP
ncbi:MAG: S41 family peptidase [Chloroflexota bacterium]|nr:S41 family peptidase [Chloroflexota bacterium]